MFVEELVIRWLRYLTIFIIMPNMMTTSVLTSTFSTRSYFQLVCLDEHHDVWDR